ncbi:hypothetical protein [Actinopolymorpha alba]|uniref:hypothetical protein n=1 Tax=Actinopolymorpha alba TaxID=533267 RepID=UPI00037ED128|nr:hypothetical protein [Actinopolymorpha alba]
MDGRLKKRLAWLGGGIGGPVLLVAGGLAQLGAADLRQVRVDTGVSLERAVDAVEAAGGEITEVVVTVDGREESEELHHLVQPEEAGRVTEAVRASFNAAIDDQLTGEMTKEPPQVERKDRIDAAIAENGVGSDLAADLQEAQRRDADGGAEGPRLDPELVTAVREDRYTEIILKVRGGDLDALDAVGTED